MKVLAISCHPDDVEVACAGTLLRCVERGDEVVVCHVANGNMGHAVIPPDELREMRREEARSAGALGGITVMTCDIGDVTLYHQDKSQRDKVVDAIRKVRPDFIITHHPDDYMPDHVAVSHLCFDASFVATIPHYETNEPFYDKLVPIYYMDPLAGLGVSPTEYVDVSSTFERKLEMLEKHESQMKWMRDHDGIDFADFVRTIAKFRGLQCGVQYAEAFTACYRWPKVVPKRLLP